MNAGGTRLSEDQRSQSPPSKIRIAIVCDLVEEKWPSMDLVAEMVMRHLICDHSAEIVATQLRPAMRMRFGRTPLIGRHHVLYNADRLVNRFIDYPRWLRPRIADFDLFHVIDHSYAQLIHELPPERTIVTCHDLDTFRCLISPEREHRSRAFRSMARRTLNGLLKAAHVICVSHATETALLQCGWFSPERVSMIHYGVSPSFTQEPDPIMDAACERELEGFGEAPILLHVGSSIPRKRIDVLLRVYAGVRKEFPQARLVRVGTTLNSAHAALAGQLRILDGVLVFPFLPREHLAAMYRRATLVLQTSDAEGFGLPVIEAMACGCPVLASDIPALREAGGSAAQYCPVGDIPAWIEAACGILRQTPEDRRAWTARATAHTAQFSWSRAMMQTVEIYRRVFGVSGLSGRCAGS